MVKMSDVAKLADVSTATVSRVINSNDIVKKETEERVLEAIKELNYQPNSLARNLRKMNSQKILLIIPDITNTFFSNILRSIESVALKNGYQVILADARNKRSIEREYLELLYQKNVDGMIMLSARLEKENIEKISEKYPVVIGCEYFPDSNVPTVSINDKRGARKITEHLINLGHKRIAHVYGPMEIILIRDRLKGYKQSLQNAGLKVDPSLIQEGDFSFESGARNIKKLLNIENPPTAIFFASDSMALGAIKTLKNKGIRVPEDIAIVGFDDIKFSSYYDPTLTTIHQPAKKIGEKAIEVLLKLLKGEEIDNKQFILEEKLIIRESCGGQQNK